MKTFPAILLTLAISVPMTWFVVRKFAGHGAPAPATQKSKAERKVLFYQSAMHPWIKADKPGRCTICGMQLTPVYEGEAGMDASGGAVVPLTQTMIQVMNVQTAEAKIRPLEKSLIVAGTIDDDATRHRVLAAYTPGRIQKLYVNYMGAEVKEGEPLAEFYSPGLLQAEREYRALSGELRQAVGLRLLQMGLTPAQIQNVPDKSGDKLTSQILAPIGGTVVAQHVYEGQYVQEGEKLLEIADFSIMWFQFRAYEQDLPWIRPGLKVDVKTPAHPGVVHTGSITFIDPTLDELTRSARVRVELKNSPPESGKRLLHRLYADGVIHLQAPEVLTVPRSAVLETGTEAVVYVEQGERKYERRVLQLGRRGNALVEVVAGLNPGDKVVLNGNLLIDGQAEMNRAFAEEIEHSVPDKMSATPLTDKQKTAVEEFLKAADAVSSALAKDDVTQFNAAGAGAMKPTEALTGAFEGREDFADIVKHLSAARHLHGAKDLASARKMFHPFSNAGARLLEMLGQTPGVPAFDLFECPMVDRAVPGVPKKGRWVQAAGRGIANPYFGSDMIDCGTKVQR